MRRPNPSYLTKVCLAACIGMLFYNLAPAQCVNNLGTKTYDTTLTNQGFAVYNFAWPQWSPDSGQLVSVKLTANVTSTYAFKLTNSNSNPATYTLNIGQEDQISAAYGAPFLGITPLTVGTYTLASGQSYQDGPFPFLTNHITADSITGNVAPFLGNNSVNINYMSFGYTNLVAYDHASYYFSNDISSTTRFSMQYLYCKAGVVLAAGLTRWTAALTTPRTVQLDWTITNETAGRQYEIQRSEDGHTFTTIALQNAVPAGNSTDYSYADHLPSDASGAIYYRLQIHENDKFSWSPVKMIAIEAEEKKLHIYPNPATDHIDIATGTANSDWQVDLLSANGGLVRHETFTRSNLLHLPFNNRLAAGTYFARITDLRGQKMSVVSFIVTTAE
jgi:hypothetical protein